MRVKQVWNYVPLPTKLKLVWDRLVFSRLTTIYIIFSLLHCIIQAALQISAFVINADAASFLYNLSVQGNATSDFAVPALGGNDIRLCKDVPMDYRDLSNCRVVWNGTANTNYWSTSDYQAAVPSASTSILVTSSSASTSSNSIPTPPAVNLGAAAGSGAAGVPPAVRPSSFVVPSVPAASSTITIVVLSTPTPQVSNSNGLINGFSSADDITDADTPAGFGLIHKRATSIKVLVEDGMVNVTVNGDNHTLSKSCLWSLNWPVNNLDNTKREDIVFIAFQFWVLGMSIVALLNESIPHIFASLLTHVLATAWSAFQITNTAQFKSTFKRVITDGACNGVPLLPNYWEDRAKLEFPILALNVVALCISGFLTWRLVKLFGWQTFKRVGASLSINRIYKLVLSLSIVLQLSFFFTGATVGLWLDNLINGVASQVAWYVPLYKATSVLVLVFLVPWLWTGWYAVRQEKRVPMFIFLVLSLLWMAAWSVMFLSTTFRWIFLTWRFFTVMSVASIFFTLLAFILGVICRYNFGKGLPRYLNAQEPLPGDDFQTVTKPSDLEKVDFPSNDKPIPTFSVAFGKGSEVPPPTQMFANRLGPRFYNRSAEPFETPRNTPPTSTAPSTVESDAPLRNSVGTIASYYSYSPTESSFTNKSENQAQQGKRWVIE